jgi:hypothetical protein
MVKVKVDDAELKRQLKKFTIGLDKTAEDSITEMARIGATQLAYRVEPYGVTKNSQTILEGAVFKDISRTYWDTGRTYNEIKKLDRKLAAAYAAAMNDGDTSKAQSIAEQVISGFSVGATDDGTHLERARNARGRVATPRPLGITGKAELDRLKARKALSAGTAKAGWLQAGASLGSKTRIAKWLKKAAALGSSQIIRNGWLTAVILVNHVRYASSVISDAKIQAAVSNAYRNHLKRLKKQLEALGRRV